MNAAWVGVVGTAVGGGIAALAAGVTGWFNTQQAELQLQAQEKEANRQRRYESLVERRSNRAKAYEDLMTEAQMVSDAIGANIAQAKRSGNPTQILPTGAGATLTKKNASVAIQGPWGVAQAGDAVVMALMQMVSLTYVPGQDGNEARVMDVFMLLSQRMTRFSDVARAALEDDGQPPEINI
ncbi:hypothetical protein SAMN05216223_11055 [Actinacidiphila yanglinensis]|uniref:Uncharacterized protein n=1 Tax=Actinacidiphila yanglinensis TaxID=310779 RepID=A0A1H6CT27_9ACTN|nr:hypothetical protein [Actinacidiphila yanglinensis]SEG76142.1 hypothetical protein SAMN05216223_11055 [Actinacidiphila yanglinensis]